MERTFETVKQNEDIESVPLLGGKKKWYESIKVDPTENCPNPKALVWLGYLFAFLSSLCLIAA